MLHLASTAPIGSVVPAWRLDAIRPRFEYFQHPPARHSLLAPYASAHEITRRRPWHEDDDAIGRPRNAIATGRNALDAELLVAHRSASRRAA
jgi:hypothetical protein